MFKDPYSQFRIVAQARVLPPPRWAKLVSWETKHDAMLLLGVHLFGFGHWDEIRNAERYIRATLVVVVVVEDAR